MLKLAIVVLALALAATASAAGWRDLRVDASSEEAFAQSMAAFKKELSPARQHVFGSALKDIWIQNASQPKPSSATTRPTSTTSCSMASGTKKS